MGGDDGDETETKQRYGFEVRRARREKNRKARRDRAARQDDDEDKVTIETSPKSSGGLAASVVRILAYPVRRVKRLTIRIRNNNKPPSSTTSSSSS